MGSLLLAVTSGVVAAEPLLLESGAGIAAASKALALNEHNCCGPPQHEVICCGHPGRPLSAPLTGDVARKARRAEGSPSDWDPSTFPIAHLDPVVVEPGSRRAANVLNQLTQQCGP